jgi:hypothetical protein
MGAEKATLGASGAKHISVKTLAEACAEWATHCRQYHGQDQCDRIPVSPIPHQQQIHTPIAELQANPDAKQNQWDKGWQAVETSAANRMAFMPPVPGSPSNTRRQHLQAQIHESLLMVQEHVGNALSSLVPPPTPLHKDLGIFASAPGNSAGNLCREPPPLPSPLSPMGERCLGSSTAYFAVNGGNSLPVVYTQS